MMKNLVKPESPKIISILRKARIRSVMVTGEKCFSYEGKDGERLWCTLSLHFAFKIKTTESEVSIVPHVKRLVFSLKGDNILTAVNVAKSCGMVGSDEKVIFVNATPHTTQSMPTLKFSFEDTQGSVEVITQVGPASLVVFVLC